MKETTLIFRLVFHCMEVFKKLVVDPLKKTIRRTLDEWINWSIYFELYHFLLICMLFLGFIIRFFLFHSYSSHLRTRIVRNFLNMYHNQIVNWKWMNYETYCGWSLSLRFLSTPLVILGLLHSHVDISTQLTSIIAPHVNWKINQLC